MIRLLPAILPILLMTWLTIDSHAIAELPDKGTLRSWIAEMKTSPKGPFFRIRWFCRDGSILPPRPYACTEHGGGIQHGEWGERTKQLRAGGYYVANVFADLDTSEIISEPGYSDILNQILIERFLMSVNDGWIFRKARHYRGALQVEDETAGARRLLLGLCGEKAWISRGLVPLRIGANYLDHGIETRTVREVRQQSLDLAEKDKGFMAIRAKIHSTPDQGDAKLVRDYAAKVKDPALRAAYERLAASIDRIYAAESVASNLKALYRKLADHPDLGAEIRTTLETLSSSKDPAIRFAVSGKLMTRLRNHLPQIRGAQLRLAAVDMSVALEVENFTAATALRPGLRDATRRERLQWLQDSTSAIYGAGLISALQLHDLQSTFEHMKGDELPIGSYKASLDYLARVPGWGTQWMRFHFHESMQTLATIEPLANRFVQDQLRGSPLLFYANVLDSLLRDANQATGLRYELFGKEVGAGLRGLNPGLARGTLRLRPADDTHDFDPEGIYLLPETIADLPPVAGILTAGEGNQLSHVQLLARNLGIPNVGVDEAFIPQLAQYEGQRVILAVSPAGVVQLSQDRGQLDPLFAKKTAESETMVRLDLMKLDLKTKQFIPLSQLRASDSGRIVGPKAAKLGELRYHYPEAVAEGLAIPFGVFRSLLDEPMRDGNKTVFAWMEQQYTRLAKMKARSKERQKATEAFRKELEAWILKADPGDGFREGLRVAMQKAFGRDKTYGVFVRSDTNVEDLPGFTGAGLNKTVPNVVGFENVLAAISEVWASPFSQRAFAWRQSHMEQPQHVYASVLLLRSVPSEKSGVMVTRDIDTGESGWLSVVINEGVGGAVDGQAAESLRINIDTGEVRRLARATALWRRDLKPGGGIARNLASGADRVLKPGETKQLITLARELPSRFPDIKDAGGNPAPADIEFGFVKGELMLFQIRPFLESRGARENDYLNSLDKGMTLQLTKTVRLDDRPMESTQ